MTGHEKVIRLAFRGDWESLLLVLRQQPELVNSASEPKGYTPLHQAAWHGACLSVIGELFALGADRRIKTNDKRQSVADIAFKKHPERFDLAYVLSDRRISLAQLIRKTIASESDLFDAYDGNQILADRLVAAFGSEPCPDRLDELDTRMDHALKALTGFGLSSDTEIDCSPNQILDLRADTRFWASRFLPTMRELAASTYGFPIEKEWGVVSDLFDPAPDSWGLRGDLFLWMELRRALCHVQIPEDLTGLRRIVESAIQALTGKHPESGTDVFVSRLARGGMSGGRVCGSFWAEEFIPLIERRGRWLQEIWSSTRQRAG